MGQVALGFRSLLIKVAIFFVMASLLAWALGGTLWPRAEVVDLDPVRFDGREWFWRLSVGGREPGRIRYAFMVLGEDGEGEPVNAFEWSEVAGPVATPNAIYTAGRAGDPPADSWRLEGISADGASTGAVLLPDRLAVEQQLARLRAGLGVDVTGGASSEGS